MRKSKSGIVAIPASAFESTMEVSSPMDLPIRGASGVGGGTGARMGGGGGGKDGRGVEAWRNAGGGMDPSILKMEGMLSMHLELEKERMKSIAGEVGVAGEKGRRR